MTAGSKVAACFFSPFPASGEGGMVLHPVFLEFLVGDTLSMKASTSVSNMPDEA